MVRTRFVLSSALAAALLLGGCKPAGEGSDATASSSAEAGDASAAVQRDPFAARDPAPGTPIEPGAADDRPRPVMQAQVVLDRLGFTPGVIDGKEGLSTRNALMGFQEANGLPQSGKLDTETRRVLAQWSNIPATRLVTIPPEFANGPFTEIPEDPDEQARLDCLCHENLDEKLAERFHTTVEVLRELNPPGGGVPKPGQPQFAAWQQIRVPNVGNDRVDPGAVKEADWAATLTSLGVASSQPQAARVVVSKSKGTLKAYDAADRLIAVYTATMGSKHDPLPLGQWKILGTDFNPQFHYNPDLFWDAKAGSDKALLKPGPNNPVGVVWIDISKEHYGIHGTPRPETIGRAESHGCVRLTNWDSARLAQMVSQQTELLFEA